MNAATPGIFAAHCSALLLLAAPSLAGPATSTPDAAGSSAGASGWHLPREAHMITVWGRGVTPENAHREYPRPQLTRKDWMNLNGLWQFAAGHAGEAPPSGHALGAQILVPFPVESALSGVMKSADRLWYRRTFEV
ncbi:MAG TPA: glycoside hydrolase family 2, partial [Bacteroidota bacterium]|nr:glycoside hydrolase family 2 [Bacteroidota bacterium]